MSDLPQNYYEKYICKNSFNYQTNKYKDLGTYLSTGNILDHLMLNVLCYADEANGLIDDYLCNSKGKSKQKIGSCIY